MLKICKKLKTNLITRINYKHVTFQKIVIPLFLFVIFFVFCFLARPTRAFEAEAFKNAVQVDCSDGVYVKFDASTFDEPVIISCRKATPKAINELANSSEALSPIYYLSIKKQADEQEIEFFRKEAIISIPKILINNQSNQDKNEDNTIFFYDEMIDDWVSYNTTDQQNNLQAKLIHTGCFAVFTKSYTSNIDIYQKIGYLVLIAGISISLIYVIIKKEH